MPEKQVVNLTGHDVTIYDEHGKKVIAKYPPCGEIATVLGDIEDATEQVGIGVPVVRPVWDIIEGLPPKQDNTVYIVSTLVLAQVCDDPAYSCDVCAPDVSFRSAVRDVNGKIIGVRRLRCN